MSALSDAIIGSIASSFDQDAAATREVMNAVVAEKMDQVEENRASRVQRVSKLLREAMSSSTPSQDEIDAYKRILERLSK